MYMWIGDCSHSFILFCFIVFRQGLNYALAGVGLSDLSVSAGIKKCKLPRLSHVAFESSQIQKNF